MRRRSPTETLVAWLITGPVGHLVGWTLDAAVLAARVVLARVRER